MNTYTYVRYFSEDDSVIRDLQVAITGLHDDLSDRERFMHPEAVRAVKRRLTVLSEAAALLTEPVPRSYGG